MIKSSALSILGILGGNPSYLFIEESVLSTIFSTMGCSPSQPAQPQSHSQHGNRTSNRPASKATAVASSSRVPQSHGISSPSILQRTNRDMTPNIRNEFLKALHKAFGALDYGVIGGTALAEFGSHELPQNDQPADRI